MLPFRTTSPDTGDTYRADGLAETLAARLSQLERFHGALWVVPASEVRQSGVTSAAGARRAFGVTLVLTGHVQRLGDRLRLTASLINALDPRQLRALGPAEYAPDDLSLQDRVVEEVARMLDVALGPTEQETLRSGGTSVGAAYPLYLEARGHSSATTRRRASGARSASSSRRSSGTPTTPSPTPASPRPSGSSTA